MLGFLLVTFVFLAVMFGMGWAFKGNNFFLYKVLAHEYEQVRREMLTLAVARSSGCRYDPTLMASCPSSDVVQREQQEKIEFTNPQNVVVEGLQCDMTLPQDNTNELFTPTSAEGTWIMCKDPNGHNVGTVYIKPMITVSPFPLNTAEQNNVPTMKTK